jgi:phospholipid transport system substrate-binding protein
MVNTEIIKSDGVVKFKVEYLIHNLGSKETPKFKIADVVTEGISMITSQQAEFESIIMNEGIERLMQILNQKIGKEGNNLY